MPDKTTRAQRWRDVPVFMAAFLGLLLCAWPSESRAQGEAVELIFLDVGQGDAIVVRAPEGNVALVDAGRNAGLVELLRANGVESIDLVVASHSDADHIGGLEAVLAALPVGAYLDNGYAARSRRHGHLLHRLRESGIEYLDASVGQFRLGSVVLTILPPPAWAEVEENNASVGVLVEHGEFRALLTGDSEQDELNHFLEMGVPDVTVLKAAHHGSRNSVTPRWVDVTRPEVVVISVGRDNAYGHPHPWALRYYEAVATDIYRTDRDGQVTVRGYRDGRYEVSTGHVSVAAGVAGTGLAEGGLTAAVPTSAGLTLWVNADAPGNDHHNLNGEYVVISNDGAETVRLAGATLCDAAAHCFVFPDEAAVAPGARVFVYTGAGTSDGVRFYMRSPRAVWNNRGDVATLRDAAGRVVATHAY